MRKRSARGGVRTSAVLAALSVLTTLGALLAACDTEERARDRGAAPQPRTLPPAPAVPSGRELPGSAHMAGFAADGSGFVLLAKCVGDAERPENGFCRQYVAVRDRGAPQWRLRDSPLGERRGTDGVSADLRVLGPGRAWVHAGLAEDRHRSWFTSDGGRSWQARDVRRAGTVASIPVGAALSAYCGYPSAPDGSACARDRLMVLSPADGRLHELTSRPPLAGRLGPATYAEPDGSWWVSGRDPGSGAPAVAVSRDAGRTWTAGVLDSPARTPGRDVRVSVGDGVVYAAETGELPAGEPVLNPVRAVHRSRDGGRTWERTWTTGARREPRTLLGVLVPGAGDDLRLSAESGQYTSRDGGRTFGRTPGGPVSGHVSTVGAGRLVSGGGCDYRLSADGVRWDAFTLSTCED
ncbi:WD40/YVTN/BNR-like repeat-containing protein [Streptomyces sp. NPDC054887]